MSSAAALDLLERSEESLTEAASSPSTCGRYVQAQMAALRAAAALVAARAPRTAGGSGPRSLWALVAQHAPELAEWAEFFAVCAVRRQRAETGQAVISPREADDLLRQTEVFVDLVARTLGLPRPPERTALLAPASWGAAAVAG